MATLRSVDEILQSLEEQVELHSERESFHAEQEELHREQRGIHAAVLEEARRKLEAFRVAVADAIELAEKSAVPSKRRTPKDLKDEDLGPAYRPKLGRMVWLLLEEKGPGERFGPVGLSREVNGRFRDRMRRPVDASQMSVVLRRLHRRGRIHLVRSGRPYKEALYVREKPSEAAE